MCSYFLSINLNICFWLLKRNISLRRFICTPTTYILVEAKRKNVFVSGYIFNTLGLLDGHTFFTKPFLYRKSIKILKKYKKKNLRTLISQDFKMFE